MGGPFWARKDEGAWSIPKGELADGEDPLAGRAARVRRGARPPAARRRRARARRDPPARRQARDRVRDRGRLRPRDARARDVRAAVAAALGPDARRSPRSTAWRGLTSRRRRRRSSPARRRCWTGSRRPSRTIKFEHRAPRGYRAAREAASGHSHARDRLPGARPGKRGRPGGLAADLRARRPRHRRPVLPDRRQRRLRHEPLPARSALRARRPTCCAASRRSTRARRRTCRPSTSTCTGLNVRSIRVDGARATWTRDGDELTITPRTARHPRGSDVHASSSPTTACPSRSATRRSACRASSTPTTATVVAGQPDVADTWYPVNDHPLDKAVLRVPRHASPPASRRSPTAC